MLDDLLGVEASLLAAPLLRPLLDVELFFWLNFKSSVICCLCFLGEVGWSMTMASSISGVKGLMFVGG